MTWQNKLYEITSIIYPAMDFMIIGSVVHAYHKQDKIPNDIDLLIKKEDIKKLVKLLGLKNREWQTRNKAVRLRTDSKWGNIDLYISVSDASGFDDLPFDNNIIVVNGQEITVPMLTLVKQIELEKVAGYTK